ncbi:hypothetical protein FRB90_007672 [Tulasnella sp. 427]|nr:hypothetical protein FRB90_007672 [Tulasnella sp. 427]
MTASPGEFAVLLHPDKAPQEHKEAAETQFRNLQRAFEILLNPERRAVYDALGEEGLKSEWRVGLKGKSPEQTQITNSTAATLSGTLFQAAADGKVRIGRVLSGTVRHQFSPALYFAASSTLLGARVVNLKAGYALDSYTDAEIEAASPLVIYAPTVKVSVSRRLHLNAVGSLSYFSGSSILEAPSSFTVSYARSASAPPSRTPLISSESHSHETTLELASNGGSVSTGYTIPLTRALTMQSGASKPLLTGELNLFLKADLRLARGLVFTCATFVGTGGLHLHLG